ncbi:MAG: tyrosine--tRNA ligase [Dehalococcoidia bacterium]
MVLDDQTLHRITRRGVAEIIVEAEFVKLLRQGKPLRLKMGFDPSQPDIHLGHVVGLRKLRQLQELGHHVILIVGDWTAQIGDPSGQSVTRPMLSREEVAANAETYLRQFFRVVRREQTEVRWQSEWFGKFTLEDIIHLTHRFTIAQLLEREDFAKRYHAGRPITLTELLYPLLQAYDSVAVQADVEFGGTDQKFNLLVGRDLQVMLGQESQQCFLMPILVGTDGVQKMSKSLDNYIGVEEPPHEMYGKTMSIADGLILPFFELLTDVPGEELEQMQRSMETNTVNPMELKKRLARELVVQFHGPDATEQAQRYFERVFQRREAPEEMREVSIQGLVSLLKKRQSEEQGRKGQEGLPPIAAAEEGYSLPVVDVLVETRLVKSRSEAKRLLAQGAVEVDGNIPEATAVFRTGTIVKAGKRKFVKLG